MLPLKLRAGLIVLRNKRKSYLKRPVTGTRMTLTATEDRRISGILHRPETDDANLPLLIELHGGAWVAGDAVLMESFCENIAASTPAVVFNLNYTKLDVAPFPNPQLELLETVRYFSENADRFGIDPKKIVVCGQSAGAHIAAGAAVMAKGRNIRIGKQILIYPFLDFTGALPNPLLTEKTKDRELEAVRALFFGTLSPKDPAVSPAAAEVQSLRGIAPAAVIACGKDSLAEHARTYARLLKEADVPVEYMEYPEAEHGFLEVNRDDYTDRHPAKKHAQAAMTKECEEWIKKEVQTLE